MKSGGSSSIVAHADADGYTLIIGHVGSTPQEYADYIAREQARWKEVIQKANVKAD